ncbi:5-methylcytosine-specific restriction enzyme A [Vibrio crassostreae]|uniref:HNH endonuclease n=1 Tax=Vibrio crassostreae TaxID=246167 RepID=UPI0005E20B3D|nr:HNH endonuclease signature motif containing protein [Vibrio crassostreae]CAK1712939.1 5-methylcytosine-specific restriction enzyme A [Vibrio crassostreae]CAK1752036.1 5-methylcytosine-specific restriction enzyme A [Vibrio crassostreae]CAK1752848.1 5-methylcytosine-specific restriction enzyme A [Vibrio crassostreae]CAK1762054.1 5-methylcytosine-specific restriction enzyme A [Vibrio crassostreae]CAK1772985.1 5-methylcytosine-specific restriction enzyme A [Vibrio crassostreae]
MLIAIVKPSEVQNVQDTFLKRIQDELDQSGRYTVGYPGGNRQLELYHNESLWFAHRLIEEKDKITRHWNIFGHAATLDPAKSNNIVAQLNFPLKGRTKQVQGIIAKDVNGLVCLLHRGRPGGGSKGLTRDAFLDWTSRELVQVQFKNGEIDEALLICKLDSSSLANDLLSFIDEFDTLKKYLKSGQQSPSDFLTLAQLRKRARSNVNIATKTTTQTIEVRERCENVKAIALKHADGTCQLCKHPAPFKKPNGKPFLEVHHIKWLSKDGSDSEENVIGLCPNCHKRMHILDEKSDVSKLTERALAFASSH